MRLSSELISQFAKLTTEKPSGNNESTVYGTVVEYGGSKYVKLDGSELLTPVSSTTRFEVDERVTVMIKNHTATVTGNITSPAPRAEEVDTLGGKVDNIGTQITEFEIVIAGKVDTVEFNAQLARIDELAADNVNIKQKLTAHEADIDKLTADDVVIKGELEARKADITNLEAQNATITGRLNAADADIESLQADNATIKGELNANKADIEELEANNATIKDLEATRAEIESLGTKYATIDFANINQAAVTKLFTDSGIINDLVVKDGHITGELVGVTIKGDLIEANTIKADKLVVKGSDGLFYKLNLDAMGETTLQEVPTDSLHGSVITAKSVTADRVNVTDLVAFGATIGGFNITLDSIYSGAKASIVNTSRGIYFDRYGQFVIGDANNYIKYYGEDGARVVYPIPDVEPNGFTQNTETLTFSTDLNYFGLGLYEAILTFCNSEQIIVPGERYRVTFDGVEYDQVAQDYQMSGVGLLGNLTALGIDSGKDMPFFIMCGAEDPVDGSTAIIATRGTETTHTVKIEKLSVGGNFNLEISASSIKMGGSGKTVEEELNQIRDEVTTNLRIESSRGTVFKNDNISTVLSAVIYRGNQRITDITALRAAMGSGAYLQWKWQRIDEDSFGVISASDSRLGNDGFTFTLSPSDVDTKVTFMCELIV